MNEKGHDEEQPILNHPTRRRALTHLAYVGAALGSTALGVWYFRHQQNAASGNQEEISSAKTGQIPFNAASLLDASGQAFDLQAFAEKKALVINFWATWCPPCIEELPLFSANLSKFQSKNAQFLAIAVDEMPAVQALMRTKNWSLPYAVAGYGGMQMMRELGNQTGKLPYTVVVSRKGAILHQHLGALKQPDIDALLSLDLSA